MSPVKKLAPVFSLFGDLTLPQATEKMHELIKNEAYMQWQIGGLYNYIVDKRLPEKNGFRFAREFFAKEFREMPKSTLDLYSQVNRSFTQEIAQKYPVSLLGKLLTYLKLSQQQIQNVDPGPLPIKIPQRDAPPLEKAFADCTRDDLARAIKALKKKPSVVPADDAVVLDRMHEALLQTLGADTQAKVNAGFENGETMVTIAHVSLSDLRNALLAIVDAHDGKVSEPPASSETPPASSATPA